MNDYCSDTRRKNPYRPQLVEEGLPIQSNEGLSNFTEVDVPPFELPHSVQEKTKSSTTSLQSLAFNRRRYENRKSLSYSSHLTIGEKTNPMNVFTENNGNHVAVGNQAFNEGSKNVYQGSSYSRFTTENTQEKRQEIQTDEETSLSMEIENFTEINHNVNPPLGNRLLQATNANTIPVNHPSLHMEQANSYQQNQVVLSSENFVSDEVEAMDVDFAPLPPFVVIDGANVAYSYADAMENTQSDGRSSLESKKVPDVTGIEVATEYFLNRGARVLVVLPVQWMRKKPMRGDLVQENAMMQTPQLDYLTYLKSQGLLCLCPPTDDDDAYIIDIARKADTNSGKSAANKVTEGAFILSYDLFRDAIERDRNRNSDYNGKDHSLGVWMKRKRISFTFYRNGNEIEGFRGTFIPNPRHELIISMEN